VQKFILALKAVRFRRQYKTPFRELVFIDPSRTIRDKDGKWHSFYMERVISLFDDENVSIISRFTETNLACDVYLDQVPREYPRPDSTELEMLNEIFIVSRKVLKSAAWTSSQKKHILSALHVFFTDFRFYYNLFKGHPIKSVVFICHYHNEALIAALNVLNIRSIELQHGLISGNDLYYQYSSTFKKAVQNAFFPDNICVYGAYWKEQLLKGCEFNFSQITLAGDYQWQAEKSDLNLKQRNQVLICSQKTMHEEYVAYAQQLNKIMSKHPDWKWVIKMHPLEMHKEQYYKLEEDGFEIIDKEKTLTELLLESRIQISIYSTTFFDALGYNVDNFSLQNYSIHSDYAASMIAEGVAHPLFCDEDPIEKHLASTGGRQLLSRDKVYAPFDMEATRHAILGENYP
jgi:hypothetical protein